MTGAAVGWPGKGVGAGVGAGVGRCVGDGDGTAVVGRGVGSGDGARVGRGVGVGVGRGVGAKTGAAVGCPGRGVGAGLDRGVGRGEGPGDDVVGLDVGDGVVGDGVGYRTLTTTSASGAVVEAAKSVRCVHAHVTPDAVFATTEQPSEDQLLVALSQYEHEAALVGQFTVTSRGSSDPPQSKVVGTSQLKVRTWD